MHGRKPKLEILKMMNDRMYEMWRMCCSWVWDQRDSIYHCGTLQWTRMWDFGRNTWNCCCCVNPGLLFCWLYLNMTEVTFSDIHLTQKLKRDQVFLLCICSCSCTRRFVQLWLTTLAVTVTEEETQVSFGRHLCCYSTGRTGRGRGQPLGRMTSGTRIWPN